MQCALSATLSQCAKTKKKTAEESRARRIDVREAHKVPAVEPIFRMLKVFSFSRRCLCLDPIEAMACVSIQFSVSRIRLAPRPERSAPAREGEQRGALLRNTTTKL